MNSSSLSAARTPFIRLLVPLLAGILYQEFLCLPIWGNLIPALCGLVLWSSFIKRDSIEEQYHKRSIFGVGLFLIVFSIGAILHGTQNRISQQPSGFYPIAIAHVNDKAVEKTNSYYCPVTITALSDTNGSIVKYKEKIEKWSVRVATTKKEKREPVMIPRFSCHIFRHTFASRFCENETNIKVIQEVMGHADVSTTMNIYAEANPDVTKSVIEKLSKNMDIF